MEVRALAKSVRMSPRKVRLIADAIRQLSIEEAFQVLQATQNRAAGPLEKVLQSAIANATTNNNLDKNNLIIASIMVNEGQALKRFHPSSRGRVHPYKKKSSHVTIILKEKLVKAAVLKADKADETKFIKAKTTKKGGKK